MSGFSLTLFYWLNLFWTPLYFILARRSLTLNNTLKNPRVLATNRRAQHNYQIVETLEVGIKLVGCEVKSCVAKNVSISESYCIVRNNELLLENSSISQYENAHHIDFNPARERVLLAHRAQIRKIKKSIESKGTTVVPLDMHIASNGKIKLLIALCKGKNVADKRRSLAEKQSKIELNRAIKNKK